MIKQKKIAELNKEVANLDDNTSKLIIIRKINEIIREINSGIVWDNKVSANRQIDAVYENLPVSITAQMLEEEANEIRTELGLNEEESEV